MLKPGDELLPVKEFKEEHTHYIRDLAEKRGMYVHAVGYDERGEWVQVGFPGTTVTVKTQNEIAMKMRERWLMTYGKTLSTGPLLWKRVEMDDGVLEYVLEDQYDLSVRYYNRVGRDPYYRVQYNFEETTYRYKTLPEASSMVDAKIKLIDRMLDEVNLLRKRLMAERKALKEQNTDGD
jgi:hypothetical protein